MAKLPKLNRRLFARIKKHIQEEPRRYNQRVTLDHSEEAPCGTEGCILGWGYLLSKPKKSWKRYITMEINGTNPSLMGLFSPARKALGMTRDEAERMFSLCNQRGAISGKEGVKAACHKIDLLLKDREQFLMVY